MSLMFHAAATPEALSTKINLNELYFGKFESSGSWRKLFLSEADEDWAVEFKELSLGKEPDLIVQNLPAEFTTKCREGNFLVYCQWKNDDARIVCPWPHDDIKRGDRFWCPIMNQRSKAKEEEETVEDEEEDEAVFIRAKPAPPPKKSRTLLKGMIEEEKKPPKIKARLQKAGLKDIIELLADKGFETAEDFETFQDFILEVDVLDWLGLQGPQIIKLQNALEDA